MPISGSVAAGDTANRLPTFSYQEVADYLRTGFWSWFGDRPHAFNMGAGGVSPNDGVLLYNLSGWDDDADGLTAGGAALARAAFDVYENVLGIDFVETTSTGSDVDIFFSDNESGAHADYRAASGSAGAIIDYASINVSSTWLSKYGSGHGSYTQQTFVHEIGHALGLGHAGAYDGTSTYVTDTDDPDYSNNSNIYLNDSWQLSIMSYFDQAENTTIDASYARVLTPMIADWIALNDIAGYSIASAYAGDTIYGFNTTITEAQSVIWNRLSDLAATNAFNIIDSDGTDTVDFSGYLEDQTIVLVQGAVSDVGGLTGNMTISPGTIIENAVAGAGDDRIEGNAADNTLTGNGGGDRLFGYAGFDTLFGGAGNDFLYVGEDGGHAEGGAGSDSLFANSLEARDILLGGDGDDFLYVYGGIDEDDRFDGGDGLDQLSFQEVASALTIDLGRGRLNNRSDGYEADLSIVSIEYITGSTGSDLIFGSSDDNILDGNGGADWIESGAGDNVLYGNDGDDELFLGAGDNTAYGGGGADTFYVSESGGKQDIDGGDDDDRLDVSTSGADWTVDLRTGTGGGGDTRVVLADVEGVRAGSGDDTLDGDSGDNELDGGGGADILRGHAGDDKIHGAAGNDIIYAESGSDTAFGGRGNDTIRANITGASFGGLGNDVVILTGAGSGGAGRLDGGAGLDLLDTSQIALGNDIDLQSGETDLANGAAMNSLNFENVITGQGADSVSGTDGANTISTRAGADSVYGRGGADEIFGGGGDDELHGGAGSDRVFGGNGNDLLVGGADGQDRLFGGQGNDVLRAGGDSNAANRVFGGAGDDDITSSGRGKYIGGDGNDTIRAGSGNSNETLDGGAGLDRLHTTLSNANLQFDLTTGLTGMAGKTYLNFEDLTAGGGDDEITGTGGRNRIIAGEGNDVVIGRGGRDTLKGGAGDDRLFGGIGNDLLLGGAGDDFLAGGRGQDQMGGGAGDDVYLVSNDVQSVVEAAGKGHDRIETRVSFDLSADAISVEDLTLLGTEALAATGNDLGNRIVGNSGNNVLAGKAGDDLLSGGAGNDRLIGGAGSDGFLFEIGDGLDKIVDFALGADTIRFSGGVASYDQLTLSQSGRNTLIDYGDGDRIIVLDVAVADLGEDLFSF